jgi:membrane protein required for colicin V production
MTGADWILIGIVILSLLVGLWRGLVFEVLSLVGWVAAFFLAQWLAVTVAVLLP